MKSNYNMEIIVTSMSKLREQSNDIYKKIPSFDSIDCKEMCKSKKCKSECCTVTGCAPVEAVLINKFIKQNQLDLPLVTEKCFWGYILPNSHKIYSADAMFGMGGPQRVGQSKCLYTKDDKCLIYEQRPLICRLFGLTELMICTYALNQKKINMDDTFKEYLLKLIELMPVEFDITII